MSKKKEYRVPKTPEEIKRIQEIHLKESQSYKEGMKRVKIKKKNGKKRKIRILKGYNTCS